MGIKNPEGERFGLLTVLGLSGKVYAPNGDKYVNVRCDCGGEKEVTYASLRNPKGTRSCGCRQGFYTHGKSKTVAYETWRGMKARCDDPKSKVYANYGGRGITYCPEWANFENFHRDMGDPPAKGLVLDRKDNELGYFKENCRWVTRLVNNQNTRANINMLYEGEMLCLAEIARRYGKLNYKALVYRHFDGITIEQLLRPAGQKLKQ